MLLWSEVLFDHISVLLNTHEVDQWSSTGVDKDVEEGEVSAGRDDDDQDGGEGLQDPVEHVELHVHQVPVLPLLPDSAADPRHLVVLVLPESVNGSIPHWCDEDVGTEADQGEDVEGIVQR